MDITQVPAGYKVTELGVLPEDWEVAKLGKHVAFRTGPFGSALHKSDYVPGGIPIVNPMQIVAGELVPTESMAISKQAAVQLSDFLLASGDIVIGRRGEMGRCAVVEAKNHGWLCGTGSMIIKASKSVNARFLQRILSSPAVVAAIESTSVGTTMINLNQSVLGNLIIPLPSPVEQQAIAEALGEMDALLAAQRARLAKQRAVKQGLLQGLLSGEKRLPGFAGEWEVKRLGDIGKTYGGLTGKSKVDFDNGNSPYVTFLNVISNIIIDTKRFSYVRIKPVDNQNRVLKGDMLFNTSSETPEEVGMCAVLKEEIPNLYLNSFCFGFRLNNQNETVADYLVYYLRSSFGRQLFYATAQGATRYNLSKVNFNKLMIPLPTPNEQHAIADVLSEADAHLAALEAEHAKTQLLKQGMMQNLLTGKIRLV